jgi:Cytochrome c oxidase subunit IV
MEWDEEEPLGPLTTAPYILWSPSEATRVPKVDLPPGWNRPNPDSLPHSTYWPSVLAFAVMLFVWGPISTWWLSGVGFILGVVALRGWVGDLIKHEDEE